MSSPDSLWLRKHLHFIFLPENQKLQSTNIDEKKQDSSGQVNFYFCSSSFTYLMLLFWFSLKFEILIPSFICHPHYLFNHRHIILKWQKKWGLYYLIPYHRGVSIKPYMQAHVRSHNGNPHFQILGYRYSLHTNLNQLPVLNNSVPILSFKIAHSQPYYCYSTSCFLFIVSL